MLEIGVQISHALFDLPDRAHNKAGKEALTEVLTEHKRERLPKHFQESARGKYHYKPRSPVYDAIKWKKFHSRTDLVRSGRTRRLAKGARIQIGGTISGSFTGSLKKNKAGRLREPGLTGYLKIPVGFVVGRRDSKRAGAVKTQDMVDEILAVTDDERRQFVQGFRNRYIARLSYYSTNRRKRVYGAKK